MGKLLKEHIELHTYSISTKEKKDKTFVFCFGSHTFEKEYNQPFIYLNKNSPNPQIIVNCINHTIDEFINELVEFIHEIS